MSKYSNLVEEIDKQEEVKEQKANLDKELQLLKQAISDLHDSIQKVEKARKDGTDMVIAIKAATNSMDMAVFAFCRAVTRAEATVLTQLLPFELFSKKFCLNISELGLEIV